MQLTALELPTDESFDEGRYLAVNSDLRAAQRRNPAFDACEHFIAHGKKEGRLMLAAHLQAMMLRKYSRFKSVLAADGYAFSDVADSFPLISRGAHFSLSDYHAESANRSPDFWTAELAANPNGRYLDLGCGLRNVVFENCLYLEVYPSPTADIIITPNTRLPLQDATLDGLGCFAVLEHVEDPFFVAAEIKRVVKPGGRIFIDWPFLQPVHGFPSHYYNATRSGLRRVFEDTFEIERIDAFPYQGADFSVRWILKWFTEGLEEGATRKRFLSMTVAELLSNPPQSEFYRACLAEMRPDMKMKLACGNTLIGRRLPLPTPRT